MKHMAMRILICLIAASVALSACQSAPPSATLEATAAPLTIPTQFAPTAPSAPLPTPSPSEIALPSNYKFVFQGQPPEREALYRDETLRAYRWLLSQGVTETGPYSVFVFADRDQWVRAMMDFFQMPEGWTMDRISYGSHDGGHGPGYLTVWTGSALYASGLRQNLILGGGDEYLQAMLLESAGLKPTDPFDAFPAWLISGSESYLGARMQDVYQPGYYAGLHAGNVTESRIHSSYMSGPLSMAEVSGSTQVDPEVLGFFALEYLSASHGGDGKIFEWHTAYRDQQPGETWRDAFQKVYGIPIQQFYEEFDAYHAVQYPIIYWDIAGTVSGVIAHGENGPIQGIWVFACPAQPDYDCVPQFTLRVYSESDDTLATVWAWFTAVPMKFGETRDITIAFARTANRDSIFGYYNSDTGFTTDPSQATTITLANGQIIDIGTTELPSEFLPPTLTPTALGSP